MTGEYPSWYDLVMTMVHAKKNLYLCAYGCCGEVQHKSNNKRTMRAIKRAERQRARREMEMDK